MNILVIPTTDWLRHPVPNRLNFIFDILAERHQVYVLGFDFKRFQNNSPRPPKCTVIPADRFHPKGLIAHYLMNNSEHRRRIEKIVKEKKIDVILSANILPSFLVEKLGVPVVFDYLDVFHEAAEVYNPGVGLGVRGIVNHNLNGASKIITVTCELRDYLIAKGFRRDIVVVPNGVDMEVMKPLPKDEAKKALGLEGNVLGYVGSLENWVDLELVIKALWFTKCSLLVVGSGLFTDYEIGLLELARKENVFDKVHFVGAVPYTELPSYISAMDIGLNPLKPMLHNKFSAGGKVFNYLACGVPVLSSNIPSLKRLLGDQIEYYQGGDDFVYKVGEMLRRGMDWDYFYFLRSLVGDYDWRLLAKKYEGVLESVVS